MKVGIMGRRKAILVDGYLRGDAYIRAGELIMGAYLENVSFCFDGGFISALVLEEGDQYYDKIICEEAYKAIARNDEVYEKLLKHETKNYENILDKPIILEIGRHEIELIGLIVGYDYYGIDRYED